MGKIYYYTSFGVLHNIVTNRELWLNSVWSMADYTEIRYFIQTLQQALENNFPELTEDSKRLFKKVSELLDKTDFYAMSFTTARDDVAMWERFAKSGKGVCLVFDLDKLQRFAKENELIISELAYPSDIVRLEQFNTIYNWLTYDKPTNPQSEIEVIENLVMTSVFHKDPAFRSEKEIRMSTNWTPQLDKRIHYKLVSEMIRKAYILTEPEMMGNIKISDMLREVIIGPTSRQSERELQDFLKKYRYNDTTVSKSACPL